MTLLWFYIIVFLFITVIIIALLAAARDTKKAGNRVIRYLLDIEERYAYYINQKIEQADSSKHSLELNKNNIVNEAIIILKPDIEALIAHINSTVYNNVKIEYYHGIFKSIAPISEQHFKQSRRHKNKKLSEAEEEEFFAAFEDAIRSDLTSRLLEIES